MIEELSIPVSEESKIPMETTGSPMETSQGFESDTVVTTLGPELLQETTLPSIDKEDETITTLPPAPEKESESDTVDAVDASEPMTTTEPPISSTEQPEFPTTTVEEVEEIIPTTTPESVEEELEPEIEIEEGACLVNGTQYPDGATVPSDNACELCQCFSGDVICPIQECPPAPAGCTALPVPEGKCCPDYSCPVAQPDEDEILDDDDDVPEEDILQKVTSSFEDETQEISDVKEHLKIMKTQVHLNESDLLLARQEIFQCLRSTLGEIIGQFFYLVTYSCDISLSHSYRSLIC